MIERARTSPSGRFRTAIAYAASSGMYAMPRTVMAMFDTRLARCCGGTVMYHRNVANSDSATIASIAFSPR
jgi:hypothetical protein